MIHPTAAVITNNKLHGSIIFDLEGSYKGNNYGTNHLRSIYVSWRWMDPVTTGLTTAVAAAAEAALFCSTFGIAHLIKGGFLGDTTHEYIEVC
jgi:hypothetical protein